MNTLKYALAVIFCCTGPLQVSAQDSYSNAILMYYNELQTFYDENGGTDYEKSNLYHAFKNIIPIEDKKYDQQDSSLVVQLLMDNAFLANEIDSATMEDESEPDLNSNETVDDLANLDDDDYSKDMDALFSENYEVSDSASLDDESDGNSEDSGTIGVEEGLLSYEDNDSHSDVDDEPALSYEDANDNTDENVDDISDGANENNYYQRTSYGNFDNVRNNDYYGSNSAHNNGELGIGRQLNPSHNGSIFPQSELDDENNHANHNSEFNGMNSYGQTPFTQQYRKKPVPVQDNQYDEQDNESQDFNYERSYRRKNDNTQYEDEHEQDYGSRNIQRNQSDFPDQYDRSSQEMNLPRNNRSFGQSDALDLNDNNPQQLSSQYPHLADQNNALQHSMPNNVQLNSNALPNSIPNNILQNQLTENTQNAPPSGDIRQNIQPNNTQPQNMPLPQNGQYENAQQNVPHINKQNTSASADTMNKAKKVKRRSNLSLNRRKERPCYILYPCQYPCYNSYFTIPSTCLQNDGCEAIDYKKQKYIQKVNDLWVLS